MISPRPDPIADLFRWMVARVNEDEFKEFLSMARACHVPAWLEKLELALSEREVNKSNVVVLNRQETQA